MRDNLLCSLFGLNDVLMHFDVARVIYVLINRKELRTTRLLESVSLSDRYWHIVVFPPCFYFDCNVPSNYIHICMQRNSRGKNSMGGGGGAESGFKRLDQKENRRKNNVWIWVIDIFNKILYSYNAAGLNICSWIRLAILARMNSSRMIIIMNKASISILLHVYWALDPKHIITHNKIIVNTIKT